MISVAAAIYARKSNSESVSDDAKSVARQVERATACAVTKGWTVASEHVFVDDAVSGAEFERRPALVRLLNLLKPQPAFGALVVFDKDRLGREQFETNYVVKQISQAGVRIFEYKNGGQEVKLDSPVDKLLMSVENFAAELEREKASQRTRDALDRKARAGYVAGGRTFGYDNRVVSITGPDGTPRRSHVERVVDPTEAAVVARIFEMAADGRGLRAIAVTLNDERARAPLPRRAGRPRSWAPSSVREILHRPLYRGIVEWGRTKKRDRWGQRRNIPRADGEWVRVEKPELRIVGDDLWAAAHARLGASRATYLTRTHGERHGRPVAARRSPYLLPGLANCAACGGGLIVRSRASSAGRPRRFVYACNYHHARGVSVCINYLLAPMEATDRAVLDTLEAEILDPAVVTRTLEKAAALMAEPMQERASRHQALVERLAVVTAEVSRLTEAIAAGAGELVPIVKALQEREDERHRIEAEFDGLMGAARLATLDTRKTRATLVAALDDWRDVLTRQTAEAREALRVLLDDRIVFKPDVAAGRYTFEGRVVIGRLISGTIEAGTFNSGGGPNGIPTSLELGTFDLVGLAVA